MSKKFTLKGKTFKCFISKYGVLLLEKCKHRNDAWELIGWMDR